MFTIIFFILFSVITTINNNYEGISEDNSNSHKFNKNSITIILLSILVGVLCDIFVKKLFFDSYLIFLAGYAFASIFSIVIANQARIKAIEKEKELINQIYQVLDSLVKEGKRSEEIDYNSVPFDIEFNKTNKKEIDRVTLKIENPDKLKDAYITQAVYNFNKFFPYRQWVSDVDYPERTCVFIGNKLPPSIAMYPGSDLRPCNWIPLGLSGNNELGWNLGAKKSEIGSSLYIYEDTKQRAGTAEISTAPQALIAGSTGGGKAIYINQVVEIQR